MAEHGRLKAEAETARYTEEEILRDEVDAAILADDDQMRGSYYSQTS